MNAQAHRLDLATRCLAALVSVVGMSAAQCGVATLAALPATGFAAYNDTGITFCGGEGLGSFSPCSGSEPAGQDAHFGRDAAAAVGALNKIGGGDAGFDFTALKASGQETAPSSGADPHPCVRDNVTGLVWEVKTADGGLRDQNSTYTWYDSAHNYGGNPGAPSGGSCKTGGRCDTEKYVADVNATALCGYTDWRMPKSTELEGIVNFGRNNPAIDPVYFPNTPISNFWSGSPNAGYPDKAWYVYFYDGWAGFVDRSYGYAVRLVRGGQ